MNFNRRKALLLVAVLTSLFYSYSFAMNRGERRIFKQLNRVATNVAVTVGGLCNAREINYSAEQSYDDCHDYFDGHREALGNIYKGRNVDDIAAGIYRHSDLGNSSGKSVIINKISEILRSFKQKSLKQKVFIMLNTLNKAAMVGASSFVVWGLFSRLVEGDTMGTDYAKKGALTLIATLAINKFLSFIH